MRSFTQIPSELKVRVKTAHTSNYPNPIEIRKGERVRVGNRDTEFPGWIRVRTLDNKEGWAPEQILDVQGAEAICNTDYCARELNTTVGEVLTAAGEIHGWYWSSNMTGLKGWVPVASVEKLS